MKMSCGIWGRNQFSIFDALSVCQFLSHVVSVFLTSQKINILVAVNSQSQFRKRNFTLVTVFKIFCFRISLVRLLVWLLSNKVFEETGWITTYEVIAFGP